MFDINQNISLPLSLVFIVGGLVALVKSADSFVAAAAVLARKLGLSPLIVGMIVIGFGTSAPELFVSILSGLAGHSDISLGNAYGSCVFNIAVVLGISTLVAPLVVKASVCRVAVPLLAGSTMLSYALLQDGRLSRVDALILLAVFLVLFPLYCLYDQKKMGVPPSECTDESEPEMSLLKSALVSLFALLVLIVSSQLLVWGCVDFARDVLHVSELVIGLTIIAMGTSLPELAAAVASARRGESEFAIGNIIGSNLFNTLGIVGVAGLLSPLADFSSYVVVRDLPMMLLVSLSLFAFGFNWKHPRVDGRLGRWVGLVWVCSFIAYAWMLVDQEIL